MAAGHLSNEDFFARLTGLFDPLRQKSHGSVYLTQKRLSYSTASTSQSFDTPAISNLPTPPRTPGVEQFADLFPNRPLPIIVRATNGKSKKHRQAGEKITISTIVEPDKIDVFFARYAEVCRQGMSRLKKRDKKKRVKGKTKKRKSGDAEKNG